MRIGTILAAALSALSGTPAAGRTSPAEAARLVGLALQDGDLVFQRSRSSQAAAVALATRSSYTHMGVILREPSGPMVLEAVEPVRLTPFAQWVARGAHGHVIVKRHRRASQLLTPEVRAKVRALGHRWLGRHYDPSFRWDDERLYCSELAYKLLDRAAGIQIGKLQRVREFDLSSPEVQRKIRERFGPGAARFDPEELVVSPQSMFEDPGLETFFQNEP